MKIIFFGTPDFVTPVLKKLQENFTVVAIVTTSNSPLASQGQALEPQLLTLTPENLGVEIIQKLKSLNPDLIVVAAYGRILSKEILNLGKYGALNIHPSLLPKYRGPSPLQTTILNGDEISGVTIIKMDEAMDHGPIVVQKEVKLEDKETFETLAKKMFEIGAELLVDIIPDFISGKVNLKEQDDSQASYCHIVKKEDGYFDINNPPSSEKLDRMIRAYYPWPGVWTKWSPLRHPEQPAKDLKIVKFLPEGLVQMEGKKPARLEDFLRGYPNFPIKKL